MSGLIAAVHTAHRSPLLLCLHKPPPNDNIQSINCLSVRYRQGLFVVEHSEYVCSSSEYVCQFVEMSIVHYRTHMYLCHEFFEKGRLISR